MYDCNTWVPSVDMLNFQPNFSLETSLLQGCIEVGLSFDLGLKVQGAIWSFLYLARAKDRNAMTGCPCEDVSLKWETGWNVIIVIGSSWSSAPKETLWMHLAQLKGNHVASWERVIKRFSKRKKYQEVIMINLCLSCKQLNEPHSAVACSPLRPVVHSAVPLAAPP